jgi:hypothetical protein
MNSEHNILALLLGKANKQLKEKLRKKKKKKKNWQQTSCMLLQQSGHRN